MVNNWDVETLRAIGLAFLAIVTVSLVLAVIFLAVAAAQLREIKIPPDAGFAETLLYTPLLVVLAIDVLDLALDFLAAPASWVILDRLGLRALRGVASVEALIPGTQLLPTMTVCWLAVRLLGTHRRAS
jgi:hypothetical protein